MNEVQGRYLGVQGKPGHLCPDPPIAGQFLGILMFVFLEKQLQINSTHCTVKSFDDSPPNTHKHQNKKGGKEGGRGNDRSDEGDAIGFRMAQQVFLLKELKERRVKRLKLRTDKDTALQLCELLTDAVWGGNESMPYFLCCYI